MKKALFIDQGYATIVFPGGAKIETTLLRVDRYVRIDDGRQYPQLCSGASHRGGTLIYFNPEQLARDCKATLYKTRHGFDAAVDRLRQDMPEWLTQPARSA